MSRLGLEESEETLERWRKGLARVRVLYRAQDGCLWGLPALTGKKTPEDFIQRSPPNLRRWLGVCVDHLDDHGALGRQSQVAFHLLRSLVLLSSDAVLEKAAQRLDGRNGMLADAGVEPLLPPDAEETYPRSWMQLHDRMGDCRWLWGKKQRAMTEEFLRGAGVPLPRESRRWVVLPEKEASRAAK